MNREKEIEEYISKGNDLYFIKNFPEAINFYKKALTLNPRQLTALINLGTVYNTLGDFQEAIKYTKKALRLKPDFPDALRNLALIYQKKGELQKALITFEKILKKYPQDLSSAQGLLIILTKINLNKKAFEKYLFLFKKLYLSDFNLFYNLANLAARRFFYQQAICFYKKTLQLKPDFPPAYASLVLIYTYLQKEKEKIKTLKTMLNFVPEKDFLWKNWALSHISLAYLRQFNYQKTIFFLQMLLKKEFEIFKNSSIYNNIFLTYRQACDWQKSEEIEKNPFFLANEDPLVNIIRCEDSLKNYQTAKNYLQNLINQNFRFNFNHLISNKRKIRLGYLSSDLRNHPVGHMTASLFGFHNRNFFEVYVYSGGANDKSYWRKRPEKEADKFIDICFYSYEETAQIIFNDKIDILIDLIGLTFGSKIQTLAYKPAPIQITWLGFPGTTGADFIDYIFADKIIIPENEKQFFSEKVVYLPGCYQINDYAQKISQKKYTRQDFNLPEEAIVFSSFNQSFKIDGKTFSLWLEILKELPESILWLLDYGKEMKNNLRREAKNLGVNPKRIIFSPYLSNDQHLKRLQLADIGLDPLIYGGHRCTTDYLLAGIPVITRLGNHFASRVSASILINFGLPELVANDLANYKRKAINLASNKNQLTKYKERIKFLRKNSSIFNTEKFVSNLEKAYFKMWEIFKKGEKPHSFNIE